MMRYLVFVSFCLPLIRAYKTGSPTCDTPAPNHGKNKIQGAEMDEVLNKMELKWMRDPNNPRNISIVVEHVAEMEGILLKYLPGNEGFKGKFVNYNWCQLKSLEDNKCITHKNSDYKPHKLKFTFNVDQDAVKATPGFEVVAVETYSRWVVNNKFVEVDTLDDHSKESR